MHEPWSISPTWRFKTNDVSWDHDYSFLNGMWWQIMHVYYHTYTCGRFQRDHIYSSGVPVYYRFRICCLPRLADWSISQASPFASSGSLHSSSKKQLHEVFVRMRSTSAVARRKQHRSCYDCIARFKRVGLESRSTQHLCRKCIGPIWCDSNWQ